MVILKRYCLNDSKDRTRIYDIIRLIIVFFTLLTDASECKVGI